MLVLYQVSHFQDVLKRDRIRRASTWAFHRRWTAVGPFCSVSHCEQWIEVTILVSVSIPEGHTIGLDIPKIISRF